VALGLQDRLHLRDRLDQPGSPLLSGQPTLPLFVEPAFQRYTSTQAYRLRVVTVVGELGTCRGHGRIGND